LKSGDALIIIFFQSKTKRSFERLSIPATTVYQHYKSQSPMCPQRSEEVMHMEEG
jgi:hypothetical protein